MSSRSLPVLIPVITGQRWSCHSCGDCCRTLVGHLTASERDRIVEQGWEQELKIAPVVRTGHSWVLNKRADGACVFLDEQNRCRIHAKFGEAAKPLACRVFPFSVRPTVRGWQASLRFDCPSVSASKGEPLGRHRDWLEALVGELDRERFPADEAVSMRRGLRAAPEEVSALFDALRGWLNNSDVSQSDRLAGAARLTGMLAAARLKNVRGKRFAELVNILCETLPGEMAEPPENPTPRQCGMLRQAAFAHAEHVSLAELRSGIGARIGKRLRQLRSARRFLRGVGLAPELPGIGGSTSFEKIESVAPASSDREAVADLVGRYVAARIEGDCVYGAGYYGWPVLDGLGALWLSIAVAGWLARYVAAAGGAEQIRFPHAAAALGIVDRAATRLPALGTWAERGRVAFVMMDDGMARLIRRYALV